MKKGIASVNGNSLPKVGETNYYEVGSFYPGTPSPSNDGDIKWKLFAEQSGGTWRELRGPQKTGRRVAFSFPEQWYGKKLLIEAYLNSAEMKAPPGIIVMPVTGQRKIDGIGFFDSNWNAVLQTPKYGQTLNVRINTVSMLGETLRVSLWERDTFSDTGHDPTENTNIWGSERTFKVQNPNGRVEFPLRLDPAWAILADKGMWDVEGSEHEFYLLVKGAGAQTKYSVQRSVKNEEIATQPSSTTTSQNNPTPPPNSPQPGANPSQPARTTSQNSPSPSPTNTPTSTPTEQQEPIKIGGIGANPPVENNGNSTTTVDLVITEGVTDAYFAKKEFTKLTGEEVSTFEYEIGSNGNKTGTNTEKTNIATIILGKANVKALSNKKEYTTVAAIIAGLTKDVYNKKDIVTFKTFKLGEEFKKIISAPLEDKVYLVTKTYFLEGKTATITVKEKDGLIKGAADAVLPLSEISEAKMASTEALTEADRTEKTSFSGTIAKVETGKNDKGEAITSEMYIVPVQLRPKTDADLAVWKEKIGKGKKDADYTYIFGGTNNITSETNKKSVAATILKNSKAGNAKNIKLADGIVAYEDDIVAALQVKTYLVDNTITFSTYKKATEMLWLNVTVSGEKEYNIDFLKSEGAYFQIGNNCFCNRDITVAEFEDILEKLRGSERISNTTGLFYADNCNLNDKSVAGFVSQLNTTLAKFDVNTCIRKIHFLAQVYHETDRFRTTKEYASGNGYNPGQHAQARTNGNTAIGDGPLYKGKGLMQLTWKNNYKYYKSYSGEDVVGSPNRVADELILAFDSAGWYWKQGKVLSAGSKWNVPNTKYSRFDNSTGKEYPKTTFDFVINGGNFSFGAVDLNLLADDDYIDTISWLVNGGGNGRIERRSYLAEIKRIFKYPADCVNAGNTVPRRGSGTVNIHFEGSTANENGISQLTRTILEEVGEASSNPDITITSTARTPAEQARIMYGNIERTGAAEQLGIYANAGDQVINTYTAGKNAGKSQAQIIGDMEAKINDVGPSTVSKHLADPAVMNTFDVSIRRLVNPNEFKTQMQARSELHQLLDENGAYHIEINQ